MTSANKISFAAKALILCGDRFLAVRRDSAKSKLYELPGGHMEC